MTSESTGFHILDRYRNISNKLKKRFLRKPNETEASEAFSTLAQECESQEFPQYAALSWIASARCEGTLGNIVSETSHLLKGARQFLEAERENVNIGCTSVPTEYLQASLACYSHASSRYAEESALPLGLDLEIINSLQLIGQTECMKVKVYLDSVVGLSKERQDSQIHCLSLLASHFLSIGDYVSALHTYHEISRLIADLPLNGYHCKMLLKCEVNSVFLLLILRSIPQNIPADLARILEKYTWEDQNDTSFQACKMSEKLFLLMQSIVIICQSLDTSGLWDIESSLWPFLSNQQKDLLRTLVRIYYP